MAGSTPSSREDFPMNAFALLPPSAANGREGRSDQVRVSCAPKGPIQVEDGDEQADVSTENPLGLLELNLAHTELRETIETLYRAIDTLEQERDTLQSENARLVDSSERARNDAAKDTEKTREKLQARDHDIVQMQHKMRELDRQKERVHFENAELQLKLDERDATISSLQAVIQQLQDQQDLARSSNRSEAEVQRLVEMWSSKERSVAENTVHMRKATVDAQRLAEQLQLQLKQAQAELLTVEMEYSTFRGYLDQHKCARTIDGNAVGGQQASSHQRHQELCDTRNRIIALEQTNLEVATENRVLRTKCKEYAKSIHILRSRMDQVQAKGMAAHNLVVKYQESANDGTQTIAELQESLVKLCDQLADERKQYVDRLSEQMHSALDVESGLRKEMDVLHEKLKKSNQDLNEVREVTKCARCTDSQAVPLSPNRDAAAQEPPQGLLSSPLQMERVRTPQPHRTPSKESKNSQVGAHIEDELEDSHDASDSTHRQNTAKRDRETQRSRDITAQATLCRLCNEEPFGFMVRCQKCKDPFHAGCVKKTGTGAKKRLGHIFKCSNCAPHRPTKVARSSGNEVSSKSTTIKDGHTLMQRTVTASLHVIPSRATAAVARPAPPEDE